MKKIEFLMGMSCLLAMLCLSGCGSNEIPSKNISVSDVYKIEDESQLSTMPGMTEPETQEESSAQEPPEEEILERFSFTFEDIYEQLQITHAFYGCELLEPIEMEAWYVEGIMLGKTYDAANTWVYCYETLEDHEIVAIKIYCKQSKKDEKNYNFEKAVENVLDIISWDGDQVQDSHVNETFSQDGIIVKFKKSQDSFVARSLLAYVNGQDFSDDICMGYSPYFTDDPCSDYPLVTYDDIVSGACAHKEVCVDVVVEEPILKSIYFSFLYWYPSGDTYVANIRRETIYHPEEESYVDILPLLENGTIVRMAIHVNGSNAFFHEIHDMMIVGETSLEEVHAGFKEFCPKMDYDEVMRNPDEYDDTYCQISGTIIQIISEGSSSAEYLLSTNAGYVYLDWPAEEEARGSRLLENDRVTVCGQIDGLKTYDTSISSKTVPRLWVIHIE